MTSNDVYQRRDRQSLSYVLRSGFVGGFAGCVAKTVVAPLDRVKILFQASNPDFQRYAGTWSGVIGAGKEMYRQNGIRGLLQGHSVTLLRIFPYAAIKYMAYDQIRPLIIPSKKKETSFRRFAAGSLAGMSSVFFTYPLELIRVRLAFQTRAFSESTSTPQLRKVISDIYHESSRYNSKNTSSPVTTVRTRLFSQLPILHFYRGFFVTIFGMIPYAGTSFLTWDFLHDRLLHHRNDSKEKPQASVTSDLVFGAVSGCVSQTVSYPFEVVRRRMQVGGLTRPDRWLGFRETVSRIWSTSGFKGFYIGLSIGYLKIIPMTATSFTVWQWGKRLLDVQ